MTGNGEIGFCPRRRFLIMFIRRVCALSDIHEQNSIIVVDGSKCRGRCSTGRYILDVGRREPWYVEQWIRVNPFSPAETGAWYKLAVKQFASAAYSYT